ncbi:hypothetical protein BGX29_010671 [Mortierella sp. GBA35]|nr:hypothetical protein BGX29_010671 [Mortierella sp. GBA35]
MTLPTEILLQILHCLPLEVLLDFRLISSWADALVLEPVFWHRLEFSKHLLFKSGSAHRRTSFGLDRVVAPGEGALGGTGTGVRTVTIEDWEGVGSVQALWASLGCFLGLRSLTIRNSALRHLTAFYNRDDGDHVHGGGGGGGGGPIWAELKELALQDCLQLRSLSGIQTWLPQLQDLSLAECTSLEDFTPLVQPTSSPSSSGPKSGTGEILALKRVSLIHTKIRDEELIALLRRSPGLEELRLDQCYELTVRALEAIAFGDKTPTTHAAGTAATEAAAQPGIDVTIQEAVLTPPYHTHPPTTTSSASTSTAPYPSVSGSGSYCPQLRLLSLKNCSDFTDEGIRSLVGCRHLEWLVIRGIRQVHEDTAEWLHSQGVPLRKLLSPLGRWRHWQV